MASKVERLLESPETLGGGGWTRLELPPPAPKGVAAAWALNRRGGKGSRKLTLIWITFSTGWNMKSRLIILIQQARTTNQFWSSGTT
ncbi:spindle and kinetochore-associated protein 2 [Hippopotamus amphibius kiboko]|uniref:spindle and kinetochore-associated protein 2 n=1 Tax=Hippopotamus amphibius kiboko TaxID=575201 RepID=UPI002591CF8A|nr:spindle and kinetochore-associated protein 2 [Hippopotamus amphibius kiboko]